MFIIDLFTFTGGIVCAVVLAYILQGIISWIVKKIKDILSRQCKIRFLCRHEWVEYHIFLHVDERSNEMYHQHMLVCRKCGKKKAIDILAEKHNET